MFLVLSLSWVSFIWFKVSIVENKGRCTCKMFLLATNAVSANNFEFFIVACFLLLASSHLLSWTIVRLIVLEPSLVRDFATLSRFPTSMGWQERGSEFFSFQADTRQNWRLRSVHTQIENAYKLRRELWLSGASPPLSSVHRTCSITRALKLHTAAYLYMTQLVDRGPIRPNDAIDLRLFPRRCCNFNKKLSSEKTW
jgi:hypothetical protein